MLRAAFPKASLETLVARLPVSADATANAPTQAAPQRGLELLEYDEAGKLISPIGQLRSKGMYVGTIVTKSGEPASWQVSYVSGGDGPLVWLTYCGAAATVEMCIKGICR